MALARFDQLILVLPDFRRFELVPFGALCGRSEVRETHVLGLRRHEMRVGFERECRVGMPQFFGHKANASPRRVPLENRNRSIGSNTGS